MRTLPEQREMLQEAIRITRDAAALGDFDTGQAALRNQEVQALTLIAMELSRVNSTRGGR